MIDLVRKWLIAFLLVFPGAARCTPYSIFTHEQLIDLTWNGAIRPLLSQRFPGLSEADLRSAHAYAYGGCAIQDLGYYPFGKSFFSNLTHYVRTGDFIASLLRNAQTADEYAFALGALSHFIGDTVGHEDAINPATSIEFPKLGAKFGPAMTYNENPHAHVRTEFGFDIDQLSKHRLAPSAYLRSIGLQVSRELLERAFYETYALHLEEVLGSRRPTFRSYVWAVRSFLPRIAYAESVIHRGQFQPDASDEVLRVYQRNLAQADFQTVWNQYRRKPGVKTFTVALLLRVVPKVGPLADAKIRIPNAKTEELYLRSVNRAVASFDGIVRGLQRHPEEVDVVADRDLDTGRKIRPGEYPLTDQTYAKLLEMLARNGERPVPLALRADVLDYFDNPGALQHSKFKASKRQRISGRVVALRNQK